MSHGLHPRYEVSRVLEAVRVGHARVDGALERRSKRVKGEVGGGGGGGDSFGCVGEREVGGGERENACRGKRARRTTTGSPLTARMHRTKPNRTKPNRTESNRTEPYRTELNRTERNQTEPSGKEQNRAEPNRTELNCTEPNHTKPNQTERNRTKPNSNAPDRPESNGTGPNRTDHALPLIKVGTVADAADCCRSRQRA